MTVIDLLATNIIARMALLALLFVAVVGVAMLVIQAVSRRISVRDDLRAITSPRESQSAMSLRAQQDDQWSRLVDRIEKAGLNLGDTKSDLLRDKMIAAGFDSPAAPRVYTLIRLVMVVLLPSIYVGLNLLSGQQISFISLYIVGSIAALAGLYIPALFIRAKADRRRESIVNGFPDALDLMLVCVEAGLGLEAALNRVGREMALSHPLVSKMLTTATLQLRAGASRETALR